MPTTLTDPSKRPTEQDVALFIDWENLRFSLWKQKLLPQLTHLVDAVREHGRLVVARAYADWLEAFFLYNKDQSHIYHAGIEPVFVPNRRHPDDDRRKNSTDVKMSIDCMDVAHSNPNIRKFVLVSGDADFVHVASSLRRIGRTVIIIGVSWSTSERMIDCVDELIFYDDRVMRREPDASPRSGPSTSLAASSASLSPLENRPDRVDQAVLTLVDLVRERREQGQYPLLSWLGQQLRRRLPDFQPERHGLKLKDLARKAEERHLVRIMTKDYEDYLLMPGEPDPPANRSSQAGSMEAEARRSTYLSSTSTADLDWSSADPIGDHAVEFEFLVGIAERIEDAPDYRFMNLVFLLNRFRTRARELSSQGEPWSRVGRLHRDQITRLIEWAIDLGLLVESTYEETDKGGIVTCLKLNRSQPFVADLLNRNGLANALGEVR